MLFRVLRYLTDDGYLYLIGAAVFGICLVWYFGTWLQGLGVSCLFLLIDSYVQDFRLRPEYYKHRLAW